MFDIGFWELALIGVVALLVVGPEKFPGLIRSVGYWLGRAREVASTLKSEIDMELDKTEKLKELLNEQIEMRDEHERIASGESESATRGKPVSTTRFKIQEHARPVKSQSSSPEDDSSEQKTQ